MKQTFMVVINSDNEIEIGQIGVPVMKALRLETIKVEKAAEQSVHLTTGNVPPKDVVEREGFYLFGIWFNRRPRGN